MSHLRTSYERLIEKAMEIHSNLIQEGNSLRGTFKFTDKKIQMERVITNHSRTQNEVLLYWGFFKNSLKSNFNIRCILNYTFFDL